MVNVANSLKLQQYLNNQNLQSDELNFLETTKLRNLILKPTFEAIKAQVSRYKELKTNVETGKGDLALQSDEMKNLANDIFYETGKDANTIQLSDLQTVDKLESILAKSNITSKNDLFVRPIYDECDPTSDYIKVELVSMNAYDRYGINTGARIAITPSGKIITTKSSLYMR